MKTNHTTANPTQPNDNAPGPNASARPFGLSRDAWGRLVLINADGIRHVGVEPVRAFPLSDPGRWISLCDGHGREIFAVQSLAELDPAIRRVLEEELAQREFVPVIRKIVRVSGETSPCDWDVETDRGATRFTLDTEDDVRRLGPHRVLITDARKLRYQVPDTRALDAASRRILDRYL
jgi:hypothetical protein